MTAEPTDTNDLHLPSLSIQGFRGIDNLEIPHLGRVTLFTGKNGVGKTTLLEAIRVFAARGNYSALANVLNAREELTEAVDEDGDKSAAPHWESLFHDRRILPESSIEIGPMNAAQRLAIEITPISGKEAEQWIKLLPRIMLEESDTRMLRTSLHGKTRSMPLFLSNLFSPSFLRYSLRTDEDNFPEEILCESLGPSVLNNASMSRFWDEVALTDHETRAVQALQFMLGDAVQRIAVIGDDSDSGPGRRAIARVKQQDHPVPLKSLGDGAVRMLGVALALANSSDGFLVIDEAENGIHHSVQRDFWTMVLRTAHENNVQVFATTHGWNCVAGFAQAAVDVDEVDGALVRIERREDKVRAVTYIEEELEVAARQGIEVR